MRWRQDSKFCRLLLTEPCPPANVTAEASCEERSAVVSWSPSPIAAAYSVVATAQDGDVRTCNATSSNCTLTGLHCEQQYTAVVKARHENCSSGASQSVAIATGECPAASNAHFPLRRPCGDFASVHRSLPAWRPLTHLPLHQPVSAAVVDAQANRWALLRLRWSI